MTIDLFSLRGRIALVTGASSGIGRVLAQGLAAAGAQIVTARAGQTGSTMSCARSRSRAVARSPHRRT